jgi:hypothetical protein
LQIEQLIQLLEPLVESEVQAFQNFGGGTIQDLAGVLMPLLGRRGGLTEEQKCQAKK